VLSFIEPDLFDNDVPLDNTTSIYLINLLWKLWLGLGLDLKLDYFSTYHKKYRKRSSYIPRISRKRTHRDDQHQERREIIF